MAILRPKTKLQVLNDFYLVEPYGEELQVDKGSGLTKEVVEALKGGKLHVPDQSEYAVRKRPMKGKVVAYGDKTKYGGKEIKLGDTVYFGYFCYAKVKHNGKEYFEMREYDLFGVERA